MGLKQDIVIKNQFTVKGPSGKGSKGSSPGRYALRYMSRPLATEPLTPIRRDRVDDFVVRYMARASAVERMSGNAPEKLTLKERRRARSVRRYMNRYGVSLQEASDALRTRFKSIHGDGGVAFGNGVVSLSDRELHDASDDIQHHFDEGKTVLKTVLSFSHDYLVRMGIVDPDMEEPEAGGYRGNIDQLRMRLAIMNGVDRMSRVCGYDDLRYVGVVQVDTKHVHCHLAMVDAGDKGPKAANGQQKGTINERAKNVLRRGVDNWLDESKKIAHLSSAVGYERTNVVSHIKRWAYTTMGTEMSTQHLMACLPDDKSLWRAKTNNRQMRKANAVARDIVENFIVNNPESMDAAMGAVTKYATERKDREGLSAEETQALIDNGRRTIVNRCVNGIYGVLKGVDGAEVQTSTPMLEAHSADLSELGARIADGDDVTTGVEQFVFRLRSYSSRLSSHRSQAQTYDAKAQVWESAYADGNATEDSRAMYNFYRSEALYHRKAAAKYQHFLPFLDDEESWRSQWEEIDDYGKRLLGLRAMAADASLPKMRNVDEAEKLGQQIYGQRGAGMLAGRDSQRKKSGRAVIASRIERMTEIFHKKVDDFRRSWSQRGVTIMPTEDVTPDDTDVRDLTRPSAVIAQRSEQFRDVDAGEEGVYAPGCAVSVSTAPEFDFSTVKGVDMHNMAFDSLADVKVGNKTLAAYVDELSRRSQAYADAEDYLLSSGQSDDIDAELGQARDDIGEMISTVRHLSSDKVLRSRMKELLRTRARQQARLRQHNEHADVVGKPTPGSTTRLDAQWAPEVISGVGSALEDVEGLESEMSQELGG